MWKILSLIFILIIAILSNFAFTTAPSEWKGNALIPFQDAPETGHLIGTFSNQSLNERAATCESGYYPCAGTSLCCSSTCGSICSSNTCCEIGGTCCGIYCCKLGRTCCDGNGCCDSSDSCCGKYCCPSTISYCCGKTSCCPNDFECCGNGNCCTEYETCQNGKCILGSTPPTTISQVVVEKIVQYFIKQQTSVLKLAKDNSFKDEEANQMDKTTKKLIDCVNNFGMSLVKALGVQKNNSCISCDQAKTLSNFDTTSTPSKNETLAMLELIYSIDEAIVDATKCKFKIKCMSGASCSQSSQGSQGSIKSPTSECNSNSVSNSLITTGIILSLTIMNQYFVYGNTLIDQS
ncbi:38063_t:CDS:1 [Gigaspora margarita]|uniref:38063_t:CDS:1 n=1 Tax=Gigaspora margarita TaxID=4874 RepID=A0ABN7VHY6_GIGMA|nr:38063_t:CDS:1 [Gigaspora margarita]